MRAKRMAVCLILTTLALTVCGCATTSGEKAWRRVISHCTESQLLSRNVLYFGPSNNLGPGTIWESHGKDGYSPEWLFDEAVPPKEQAKYVNIGASFVCSGEYESEFKLNPSLLLESKASPLTGEMKADFKRAKTIRAKVNELQQIDLIGGPYDRMFENLDENNAYHKALRDKKYKVMTRAFKVVGLEAELDFDNQIAVDLTAKYAPKEGLLGDGSLAVKVDFDWKDDNTLVIKAASSEDVYLAGELKNRKDLGYAGGKVEYILELLPKSAKVLRSSRIQ